MGRTGTNFAQRLSVAIVSHRFALWYCDSKTFLPLAFWEQSYFGNCLKGQLQRFHKLISNDRIWPSEHDFEVIFEKSLFVFEISGFKVRNKRGIHSRFHSFSENNNRETFVCDVTSDQSSMISTERSDLRDCKASGNCYV